VRCGRRREKEDVRAIAKEHNFKKGRRTSSFFIFGAQEKSKRKLLWGGGRAGRVGNKKRMYPKKRITSDRYEGFSNC